MHQSRGLHSVTLAFLPQIAGGKLAEFLVNERREVIEGLLVTLRPLGQESRHIMGSRHGLRIENAELRSWRLYTDVLSFSPAAHQPAKRRLLLHDRFPLRFSHV